MSETTQLPEFDVDELHLRLVTLDDADAVYQLIERNRENLAPWVGWVNQEFDEAKNRQFIQENLDNYERGVAYAMGVYDKGVLCGVVDIRGLGPDYSSEGRTEVGYYVDKEYRGRGIAPRATSALIDFARERHNFDTVILHTYKDNMASSRVAEKLGFVFEKDVVTDGVEEKKYKKELGPRGQTKTS